MIGVDGVDESNVADKLLAITGQDRRDHVYTLHAELEGMKLAPIFEKLLEGWAAQGYELVALRDVVDRTDLAKLPLCSVVEGAIAGRSGTLATQGPPFLAEESSQYLAFFKEVVHDGLWPCITPSHGCNRMTETSALSDFELPATGNPRIPPSAPDGRALHPRFDGIPGSRRADPELLLPPPRPTRCRTIR